MLDGDAKLANGAHERLHDGRVRFPSITRTNVHSTIRAMAAGVEVVTGINLLLVG